MVRQVRVGVAAFHDSSQIAGVGLAHGFRGCGDMLRRFDHGHAGVCVLGEPNLGSGLGVRANCLNPQPMSEQGVVADLIDACRSKLQARSVASVAVADRFITGLGTG